MIVLGIDPSLSNTGFVLADLDMETLNYTVLDMYLSETTKTKTKSARVNSDDLERARKHATHLKRMISSADMVFCEVPHGSQSARAMASYGVCIGLLAVIEKPLIQVTAKQVKEAAVGDGTASKNDMILWAVSRHPDADWLKSKDRVLGKNEHLADAIASIEAGLLTEDFKSAIAMYKFMKAA
tara:strand:- start:3829 stop:4377 length:549 start_codon:yes stop_codon:yes gene_type:complete